MSEISHLPSLFQGMKPGQVFPLLQHEVASVGLDKLEGALKDKLANINFSFADTHPRAHIIYAVDVFDIQEYCFPFGFNKPITDLDLDSLSKWLTGWYHFFEFRAQIVLMDEHRAELGNLRNRVVRILHQHAEKFTEFDELINKKYQSLEDERLSEEEIVELKNDIFNNKLPWLIAAVTGELHNGPERFRKLLEKIVINPDHGGSEIAAPWLSETEREEHAEIIKAVFADTRPSKDAFARYLNSMDDYQEKEIELSDRRRENMLADYNATDRIVEINKKFALLEKDLKCRYIVLYLSSDNKSHLLAKEILSNSPRMYGRPMNLMKNASQLWLEYWLCSPLQPAGEADKQGQSSLESIENLLVFYSTISQQMPMTDKRVIERITQLQERLQWFGLMKSATTFSDKLDEVFSELIQKSTYTPFRLALEELNNTLKNTSGKEGLIQFQKELRSFSIQVTVFQKIKTVLGLEPTPDVSSMGYVVGINHHLPTLFAKIGSGSPYEKLIARTVDVILSPGKSENYSSELRALSIDINTLLMEQDSTDMMDATDEWPNLVNYYERQSLLYLFSLLLPATNLSTLSSSARIAATAKSANLDYEMNSLLESDINALQKVTRVKDVNDTGEGIEKYRKELNLILSNLYYIQTWSLRRNNKLEECKLALQNFKTHSENQVNNGEDVRIAHGTALLSYSQLIYLMHESELESFEFIQADELLKRLWKIAQKDIEKAISAYENGNDMEFARIPFERANSALINSLIYIYVVGYAISKENGRLTIARNLLDTNLDAFQEDRRKNPEYMHTEANLEFFESHYYLTSDKVKAKQKIEFALQTINQACQIHQKLFPHKMEDKDYINLKLTIEEFKRNNFG